MSTMEGLHKMQDDLEKVIEKDDDTSTVTTGAGSDCEETTLKHGSLTCRQQLDIVIHSSKFQVGVVVLVVVDVLLVLGELLLDLEVVELTEEHQESVPHALHYCSISILCLFLLEITLRIFVMRLNFFKHKLELFDALIVVVSFVLDVVFMDRNDAATGVGLLVILRLWRVTRILNGIVLSVKRQAEKKVERERHAREACEQELSKFRAYCSGLEAEMDYLHRLLKEHGIPFTQKVQKPPVRQQISVEVEVEVSPRSRSQEEEEEGEGAVMSDGVFTKSAGEGKVAGVNSVKDNHSHPNNHHHHSNGGEVNGNVEVKQAGIASSWSSSSQRGPDVADIIILESTTTTEAMS